MTAPRRSFWLAGLTVASLGSCGVYLLRSRALLGLGLPLDDAWIHQTYARSLADRGEWAFQAGEPSAGSTSPLWSGILALGRLISIDNLAWTYLVGALLLALTAWTLASWIRSRHPGSRWIASAAALVLLEWHLVWASVSGMEILAVGLLALVTLYLADRGRLGPFWLGGLIGLATWLRPEAVLLALPVGWIFVWRAGREMRSRLRSAAAAGLGLLLPLAGYGYFNWALSGHWLPNTWYAKAAEYAVLRQIPLLVRVAAQLGVTGEAMGFPGLAPGGPIVGPVILLLPGIALAIRTGWRRDGPASLAPILWVLAHLGAYAVRLPATYQHGRYAMPVIPVLLALGAEGLIGWCSLPSRQALRATVSRAWPISLSLVTLFFWLTGASAYAQDVAIIESEMVTAARWVADHTSPGALVAAHDIGALGYFGQRRILDLAGLVSPEVIPILRDERALADLLDQRRADYLVSFPGWYPQLTRDLPPVFATRGRFSPAAGGENLVIYRWERPTIGP
jgi:hypothetical protein